jgi:hypothetical protein
MKTSFAVIHQNKDLLAVIVFIAETPFQILSSGLIALLPYNCRVLAGLVITESGLPGVLFSMLDTETDSRLIKDIHDTLTSMLQMMAADNLSQWLSLCKDVLTVATGQYLFNILLEYMFSLLSASVSVKYSRWQQKHVLTSALKDQWKPILIILIAFSLSLY